MNPFCVVLLIAAAGVIGRLWPRKPVPPIVINTSKQEYGLFLPPDCESVEFKNLIYYHTYHHQYDDKTVYNSMTIKNPAKISVAFKINTLGRRLSDNEVKGVVKSGD